MSSSPDGQLRALAPQARILIYNNLQNPLGCESSPEEMAEIARIAIEHDLTVLSDEARAQRIISTANNSYSQRTHLR